MSVQFPFYASVGSPTSPARAVLDGHAVTGARSVIGTGGVIPTYGWADNWAVKFDGASSFATRVQAGFPTAAGSLSAWVRVDATLTTGTAYNFLGSSSGNGFFTLGKAGGADTLTLRGNFSSSGVTSHFSAVTYSIGTWVHLLCTFDGTNFRTYINGTLYQTTNRAGQTLVLAGTNYYIGRSGSVFSPVTIRQVSIWSRAVDVSEVASSNLPIDLAPANSAGVLVPASGLFRWYQLGQGYNWDTYKFDDSLGGTVFSWTNGVQTTQVVPR